MYTYNDLKSFIEKGRNKQSRVIHHNTIVRLDNNDRIVITFHSTDIMEFTPNNQVILNTSGYRTYTTKERINRYLNYPFSVYQSKKIWYLRDYKKDIDYPFADNMIIDYKDNTVTGYASLNDVKSNKKLINQVKKYCREYTTLFLEGKLNKPDSGDCFYCYLDFPDNWDNEHIISHINEDYYVPSLLIRAIKSYPTSIITNSVIHNIWYEDKKEDLGYLKNIAYEQIKKSLEKYMLHCLKLG